MSTNQAFLQELHLEELSQNIRTVIYLRSLLVELSAVVKDQFHVSNKLRHVSAIGLCPHLPHNCPNVHRAFNYLHILLVKLITNRLFAHWL